MSFSTLKQLVARFLKFLVSSHGLTPYRLINRFLAFLSFLRRWTRTLDPQRPVLRQRLEGSTAAQDDGVVYPMNVPSTGLSDTLRRGWHSHTDLPYITDRSRSGGHLIPPTPARRHSRDAPWNPEENPINDEPDSIISDTSRVVNSPILWADSNTNVHNPQDSHTPNSAAHPSPSLNPQHRTNDLIAETSSLSRSPSRLSISRMSRISARSGQSLYREYHGPPAHVHIPTPVQDMSILGSSSSTTLRRGGLSNVMAFENATATPNLDDASQGGCRFFPMSTSGVLRYERGRTRPPSECDHKIEAMWFEYPKTLQDIPEGWTAHRHPEGALYFVHDETKTFTEVDICDPDAHANIEYYSTFLFSELQTEIRNRNLTESLNIDDVQLVLEPKVDKLGLMCCYYFVNPRSRTLFWLDEWEADEILRECRGILSTPHKGLAIQEHYWCVVYVLAPQDVTIHLPDTLRHWNLYPNFGEITEALKGEVVRMISHGICDHLTSRKPTSPLNTEELESHLSLIERIRPNEPDKHGHFATIIGRIMSEFYHVYFLHFHGEDCARLDLDQRIYGWQYQPSLLMTTVAPLLFMTPVHKMRELHKIYVDDIVNRETWNKLVAKLNTELEEASVLLATVLLNANVSFLQVLGTVPSYPQFFTYMSLVASMASIILGLVLMGHSRTNARTPSEAAKFLDGLWHEKHGLENLAIIYSLPQSFLMWSMIFFFVASLIQWFYPGDRGWRGGAGAFLLVVMFFIAWCIWTTRDRCHYWWFQFDSKHVTTEGPDRDEGGIGNVFLRIPGFNHLRRFTSLFSRRSTISRSHSGESHSMQTVEIDVPNPLGPRS